jgi:PIN domain nuclease of toxin-antitoxin system
MVTFAPVAPASPDIRTGRRKPRAVLPISLDHALRAGLLEGAHRGPFDRILIAQSRMEDLPVVTKDPCFASTEWT